jgi:hypothetical protein
MSVEVSTVDTKPQVDPYHLNTTQPTYTALKIFPQERRVIVCQEQDDRAMPPDEWRWRTVVLSFTEVRPDEEALRDYLQSLAGQALLDRICDGHSLVWDNSNLIGHLTFDADVAYGELYEAIADLPESDWTLLTCADYLDGDAKQYAIDGDTTDEQLQSLADELERYALEDHVVLADRAIDFLRALCQEEREKEG